LTRQDGAVSERAWSQDDVAQRLRFGSGAVAGLPGLLRELGLRRVILVTSAGRRASEDGERVARTLGRSLVSTFAGAEPHVPADGVRAAFAQAQADSVDGVVTFGGGSVVDCGKAVAFFVEQQGGTPGQSVLDRPALVHVAVPTTYSPAALTGLFTMTDVHTRTNAMAGTPTSAPTAVVYDPDLLADLGPATAAGTAIDALAAAVAGTHEPGRSPETEALAFAACPRIAGVLPLAIDTPDDEVVRADLLEGVALAARVLQRIGPGPHQAIAQLIGGRTGAPHGVVSAILLPHTAGRQAATAPTAFGRLAELMGGEDVATVAYELLERVGLPVRLGALGIEAADLEAVARQSQAHPGIQRASAAWSEAEVSALLAAAW
jgi:maleylacetate reductase